VLGVARRRDQDARRGQGAGLSRPIENQVDH
jgi:hypothetical protein